jgi:chemotaxis protein methyltransferase CheR
VSTVTRTGVADDYVDFCEGIRRLTQIDLAQYKRGQMERRIRSFAGRGGIDDLGEYLSALRADKGRLDEFLDRMTINVSQLWRNPEQWDMLAGKVVPELADHGRIRAWSAGSSYGAEAYTLAAVCREVAPRTRTDIRGTDIDRRVVMRARDGEFDADDARSAPKAALERWFEPYQDGWRAKRELKAITTFDVGDLLRIRPPVGQFDLVLCRNTVIYFTEEVRDALHGRLAESLRTGGYLMVGSTERVSNPAALGLEPAHPFTYRKV